MRWEVVFGLAIAMLGTVLLLLTVRDPAPSGARGALFAASSPPLEMQPVVPPAAADPPAVPPRLEATAQSSYAEVKIRRGRLLLELPASAGPQDNPTLLQTPRDVNAAASDGSGRVSDALPASATITFRDKESHTFAYCPLSSPSRLPLQKLLRSHMRGDAAGAPVGPEALFVFESVSIQYPEPFFPPRNGKGQAMFNGVTRIRSLLTNKLVAVSTACVVPRGKPDACALVCLDDDDEQRPNVTAYATTFTLRFKPEAKDSSIEPHDMAVASPLLNGGVATTPQGFAVSAAGSPAKMIIVVVSALFPAVASMSRQEQRAFFRGTAAALQAPLNRSAHNYEPRVFCVETGKDRRMPLLRHVLVSRTANLTQSLTLRVSRVSAAFLVGLATCPCEAVLFVEETEGGGPPATVQMGALSLVINRISFENYHGLVHPYGMLQSAAAANNFIGAVKRLENATTSVTLNYILYVLNKGDSNIPKAKIPHFTQEEKNTFAWKYWKFALGELDHLNEINNTPGAVHAVDEWTGLQFGYQFQTETISAPKVVQFAKKFYGETRRRLLALLTPAQLAEEKQWTVYDARQRIVDRSGHRIRGIDDGYAAGLLGLLTSNSSVDRKRLHPVESLKRGASLQEQFARINSGSNFLAGEGAFFVWMLVAPPNATFVLVYEGWGNHSHPSIFFSVLMPMRPDLRLINVMVRHAKPVTNFSDRVYKETLLPLAAPSLGLVEAALQRSTCNHASVVYVMKEKLLCGPQPTGKWLQW